MAERRVNPLAFLFVGAATFAVGMVVGGIGPNQRVEALEAEVFELRKAQAASPRSQAAEALTKLVMDGMSDAKASRGGFDDDTDAGDGTRPRPYFPDRQRYGADGEPVPPPEPDERTPEQRRTDNLDAALETLELRRTQARAALFEDASPTASQADAIDLAVADMNDELVRIAQDFVADVRVNGEPDRRAFMSQAADALDVMVATEQRMLDIVGPGVSVREEATDPTSFVDPEVMRVLSELQGLEPPDGGP